MPREHLFLDGEEDTIHANEIVPKTAKEKRANWWFYHKVHLLVGVLLVALVGGVIYSLLSRTSPDYTIAIVGGSFYSDDMITKMEEQMAPYGEDRNGDGQVQVEVLTYAVGGSGDPQMQEINGVRMLGDASEFTSVIYLTDDTGFEWVENEDSFFAYTDGSTPPEGASDYENMRVAWEECKGLTSLDLSSDALSKEEMQTYMSSFSMSLRVIDGTGFDKNEDDVDYYKDCQAMFQRLIDGTPVEAEADS